MEPFKNDRKFESAFHLAFEGVEIVPSAHIWNKIEVELSRDQNGNYKKRIFAFQLVAAASLLFAASLGIFQVLNRSDESPSSRDIQSADQTPNLQKSKPSQGNKEIAPAPVLTEEATDENLMEQSPDLLTDHKDQIDKNIVEKTPSQIDKEVINDMTLADAARSDQLEKSDEIIEESGSQILENRSDLQVTSFISLQGPNLKIVNNMIELQFVPVWVKKKDDSERKSKQWASAGMSAGSYSPSSGGGGLILGLAQDDSETASGGPDYSQSGGVYSDQQSGSAFSVGVGFGGKVARKWILESGLNYIRSEISGTTNSIVESNNRQYPLFHDTSLNGDVLNVAVYDVKDHLQFISVPLKAGYILIDRRVGWVATGGFGSNILLTNSLESVSGDLEKVKFSSGDSPYRRVSLSGIIGTEVYFNLTENYQLVIVPQYNFGITELTKAQSSFTMVPNSFNVGVTFRYLLK